MIRLNRRHVLLSGVVLILAVNAVVLGNVAYNRSGEPESRLQLSERELRAPMGRSMRSENSGVELQLVWRVSIDPAERDSAGYGYETWARDPAWLDRDKLEALGFSLPAEPPGNRYQWQPTKEVLLVLELDGPASQQAAARARDKADEEARLADANPGNKEFERRLKTAREAAQRETQENSRLFAIDAGRDAAALRAQYPDVSRFLIVKGHVRPMLTHRDRQARYRGHISNVSISRINVPVEWQTALNEGKGVGNKARFNATVAWGKRLEPWLENISSRPSPAGKPQNPN